jgi:hypothetical protein
MIFEIEFISGNVKALPPVGLKNIPKIITVIIGPIRHRDISPKLSSSDVLSPRTDAKPSPRAIIKGTIIGPVVTAPDSKAMDRKFFSVKADNMKAIA